MFRFINREKELEFLEERFREKEKQLLILYGRRRVGKTELVKRFFRGKDFIYFLADRRGTLLNAERFAGIAAEHFDDVTPRVNDFDDVFRYIVKRSGEDLIIAIDEFSYLVEKDDAVPSIFQLIWDEIISKKKIMLILLGSLISMMEKGALSYKSPLYGRRTGQWKLLPLPFKEAVKFHRIPMEDSIKVYAVFGGIPMYLKEYDKDKDIFSNIMDKVIKKGSPLYEEVEFLLREELRDYSSYLSILEALAKGNSRLVEVANYSKISAKDLPKYFNTLIKLNLIEKNHPITEKEKTKKTLYKITDNFFKFWFKFVYPNKSDIEIGNLAKVRGIVRREFNSFVGEAFEDIAREFLLELNKSSRLPFRFSKIGRWWHKGEEIDLVALNDETKDIVFFEVKWGKLTKKDADRLLSEVKRKAELVKWHNRSRKEHYGITAREIAGREELRREGILAYDLADFELFLAK
jgi:hypothetical protein